MGITQTNKWEPSGQKPDHIVGSIPAPTSSRSLMTKFAPWSLSGWLCLFGGLPRGKFHWFTWSLVFVLSHAQTAWRREAQGVKLQNVDPDNRTRIRAADSIPNAEEWDQISTGEMCTVRLLYLPKTNKITQTQIPKTFLWMIKKQKI